MAQTCLPTCSFLYMLRSECVEHPCLFMEGQCQSSPAYTTPGEGCPAFCCLLSTPRLIEVAIASCSIIVLLLVLLAKIYAVWKRRRLVERTEKERQRFERKDDQFNF